MKISFVVLHYNQSKYIKDSIYSLVYSGLNHDEIEIIILDDCSSLEEYENLKYIIKEIKKNYNISVYVYREERNTKNQSLLRNKGIKQANGDYIAFLDGDDYINSLSLNKMFDFMKNNNYDIYFTTRILGWNFENKKSYNKLIVDPNNEESYACGISHYIIKKEILNKYNIFFEETKYFFDTEDLYFYCILLSKLPEIKNNVFYNIYLTCKNINKNSNTYSKLKKRDYPKYMSQMINDIYKNIAGCKNELYICNILNVTLKREIHRWFEFNNKGDV